MSGREDDFDRISELVLQGLERLEREGPAGLEQLLREHPERAEEVRRRLAPLLNTGLLRPPGEPEVPARLGEFTLLDPLGGGGMGLVYRARQESLGREVALKLIRPDQLAFPEARARFRREVEVIARLQHPGIVPVYAFGEENGTPFFAMERVHGATLDEILQELEGRDSGGLSGKDLAWGLRTALDRRGGGALEVTDAALFRMPWDRACASIVIDVARALEHAHDSGVLHRDLKPSNVMLTVDGRALLFDFGLSSPDWVGKLTRSGSILGSLPYMAPEQVRGAGADRRSDVYGFGATLYELLSLHPPFRDERALDLRSAILNGVAPAIRSVNASVSRDLELVCAKAMDRDAERRYATAGALADDLERALSLRPVEARPAGVALRTRRWWQRDPARAVAVLLAVVVVVGGPLGFAFERWRAASLLEAEVTRAEDNLREAVEALVDVAGPVGHTGLDGLPGAEPLRREILIQARERLERLLPQLSGDTDRRRDHARLSAQLGRVLRELGELEPARDALLESIARFEALRGGPDDARLDWDLGAARSELAVLQWRLSEQAAGVESMEDAVRLLRSAAEALPDERDLARDFALGLAQLGDFYGTYRGPAAAREPLAEARSRLTELAADGAWGPRFDLAEVEVEIAGHMLAGGDPAEARELAARARTLLEGLIDERPSRWDARERLLDLLSSFSHPFFGHLDLPQLEADARRALELQGDLARMSPRDPDLCRKRALVLQNLAATLSMDARGDEALATLEEAALAARDFAARAPGLEAEALLGRILGKRALVLRDAGRLDDAREADREALALKEAVFRAAPENAQAELTFGTQAILSCKLRVMLGETVPRDELMAIVEGPLHGRVRGYYQLAVIDCLVAERLRLTGDDDGAERTLDLALADFGRALEAGYELGDMTTEEADLALLRGHPGWSDLVASQ
ncbi:MAG: protein kinase [Planctomycetota bacterium]